MWSMAGPAVRGGGCVMTWRAEEGRDDFGEVLQIEMSRVIQEARHIGQAAGKVRQSSQPSQEQERELMGRWFGLVEAIPDRAVRLARTTDSSPIRPVVRHEPRFASIR